MDLETIAAYIEGRLPPERMAEVAAYLARSPDDYQVFADAAALRAELLANPALDAASEPAPAGLRRWPQRYRWVYAGAASAAAVAALLLVTRAMQPIPAPLFLSAEELRISGGSGSLDTRLGENWATPPWSRMRGGDDDATAGPSAFRAGAVASHVMLAADADDPPALRAAARDLDAALSLPAADPVVARIGELANAPAAPGLREALATAVASLRAVNQADWFDLGVWAEQARIAVIAQDAAFFTADEKRVELRSLRRRLEGQAAAETVVAKIDALLTELGQQSASLDFELIRQRVEEIFQSAA